MFLESTAKPASTTNEGSSTSSLQLALTFSPEEEIEKAFTKLSAGVKAIIRNSNFDVMQEACIEKALSPKNLFSEKLISSIEQVNTFNNLCLTLAKSSQWNFLDTRMMEAMVTASMIPVAQQSLENFKKAYFGKKLDEVVPHYVPVIPLKPGHTILREVLNKDPRDLTIAELHEHCFYLETELLETGRGTLSYYKIMVGSVIIEWQIHVDYIYQLRLLLRKKQAMLSSQAISQLSIPDAIKWAGLPVLWIGQEIGQIGPIEPLTDNVQKQPYLLPKGFEWMHMHSTTELAEVNEMFQEDCQSDTFIHSQQHTKSTILSIRSSTTKNFAMIIWGIPVCVSIRGKLLTLVCLKRRYTSNTNKDFLNLLDNIAMKEIMRQFQCGRINQAILFPASFSAFLAGTPIDAEIIQPVVTLGSWFIKLDHLPYSTPQTAGLRKITSEDVPSALAVTNKYTSQFKIGHVFQSEEEFSYWFLPSSVPNKDVVFFTYVVEDPTTGNVTDMFSIAITNILKPQSAYVTALVNTKTPAKQLITDLLLCAKQEQVSEIFTHQFGHKREVFEETFSTLLFQPRYHSTPLYLYNYNYPEVDEDNFVLYPYTGLRNMYNALSYSIESYN